MSGGRLTSATNVDAQSHRWTLATDGNRRLRRFARTDLTVRLSIRRVLLSITLLMFAMGSLPGHEQRAGQATDTKGSPTIKAKTPVFAGACKACPWGILAKVTADALSFYGYRTTVCWVCWSNLGPRYMADKTKPVMPPNAQFEVPEYIEPPPDAVPDISATSESNLIDAWNGTGAYAADHKPRRNYRVVAVIRTSTYILAAVSKKSGITNLRQIKDRKEPTWIAGGNGNDLIFQYYGINLDDLRVKGGGLVPPVGTGDNRVTREK